MTPTNENDPQAIPVFGREEEIVGAYAYQSGVISQTEAELIKSTPEEVVPGFSGPYATKKAGKKTVINGPTEIVEKRFPTRITVKEPGFIANALAKVLLGRPAFAKVEKQRALHALHNHRD